MIKKKPSLLSIHVSVFAFILALLAVCFILKSQLIGAFQHNIPLNTLIISSFFAGFFVNLITLWRLNKDLKWAHQTFTHQEGSDKSSFYLTKLAAWGTKRTHLSFDEGKDILQDIESKFLSAKVLSKYLTGLLIFLGLLGTFWGLSTTIRSVSLVIATLSDTATDSMTSFNLLKKGLNEPLSGMGTAFSCSMFGLSCSLILGFLDFQISRAQNRLYFYIEKNVHAAERKRSSLFQESASEPLTPDYLIKILEFMAENIEQMNTQQQHNLEKMSLLKARFEQMIVTITDLSLALKSQTKSKAHETESIITALQNIAASFTQTLDQQKKEQQNKEAQIFEGLQKEVRLLGKVLHPYSQKAQAAPPTIKAV